MSAEPAEAKSPFLAKYGPLRYSMRSTSSGIRKFRSAVALAVAMRRHVDRQAVDAGREVGAVVEVEAAQEVLVGLAVARVLRDDEAGHELEHLARAQGGAALQQLGADHALRGCVGAAHRVVVMAAGDLDLVELRGNGHVLLLSMQGCGEAGQRGGKRQCVKRRRRSDVHPGLTQPAAAWMHTQAAQNPIITPNETRNGSCVTGLRDE
jgi:hypothetical protein